MCERIITIQRPTTKIWTIVPLIAATNTLFMPYNPKRQAIMFDNAQGGTHTISQEATFDSTKGFLFLAANGPMLLTRELYGAILDGPLYARIGPAGNSMTCLESFYTD